MKKRIQIILLSGISLLLLVLCVQTRLYADKTLDSSITLNDTIQDPWKDTIFSERDFSNLVISIQASEEDLYAEETGLLTSVSMPYGQEGERKIQIFVYDENGSPLIAQNAGIRVSGAASRSAARKSFRVIARKDYDKNHSKFTYDLWDGRQTLDGTHQEIREYSSFIIHSMRLAMDATGIHNSVGLLNYTISPTLMTSRWLLCLKKKKRDINRIRRYWKII